MKLFRKYYDKLTILDKYILKQVFEVFLLGMTIFTGLMFASDPFLRLIKEISTFGMPIHIAVIIILLNLPAILVLSIPMSSLFATIMVLNKLCLASEVTIFKACGIGLHRISASIVLFSVFLAGVSFFINETIVPITNQQSKTLALWSLGQKHIPNGQHNFVLKEIGEDNGLKRLFFVDKCEKDTLYNVVVLDMSSEKDNYISYAKTGKTVHGGWALEKGISYNIDNQNFEESTNVMYDTTIAHFGIDFKDEIEKKQIREYNVFALQKYLEQLKEKSDDIKKIIEYQIMYYDKFALPVTTIVLVLIGIPLAITPPRVRYNRGILFSILILFLFYVIRALTLSLGEAGKIDPVLAVWLPNIIVGALGLILYLRKVYKIT